MRAELKGFKRIKRALNSDTFKEELEGFFFDIKAIELLEKVDTKYHMNSYYDLTNWQVLLRVDEFETLEEVKVDLYKEYQEYYASSWYENFLDIMRKVAEL